MIVFSFERNIYIEVEKVDLYKKVFKPLGYAKWYSYGNDKYSKIYKRKK